MFDIWILLNSLLYWVLGIVLYGLTFLLLKIVLPFDFMKEIEQDQNIAIGIMVAGIFIGISIIIAAAIHG